jgi:Neutral/alkaline non-lysosomal ceramidase, N-terminal
MTRFLWTIAAVCLLLTGLAFPAPAADKGTLRAGAARADVTPAADLAVLMSGYASRDQGHKDIHDPIYFRVIVVDDGAAQAAIIGSDFAAIPDGFWETMSARIAHETGIPRENILLTATHTHAAPDLARLADTDNPRHAAYYQEIQDKLAAAVREARDKLQPARFGFGTGKASVNMNRRARMADGGYWLGDNPDGPSNKTVAVLKFENESGAPIAILANYSVHGTVMGPRNYSISGDLPGETARDVEQHYGGDVVAPWTSAAAGDQDPIYRVGTDFDNVTVLGRILAEEVIRVADTIKTSNRVSVRGAQRVVTCPGKTNPPGPARRPDLKYEFLDADPADIRLSLLMLNHVAITGVSGEVLTGIETHLDKETPFRATLMLTHANGRSGYIPDDAAYEKVSYEIVSTHFKQGCAEGAIVNGLLDMMDGL